MKIINGTDILQEDNIKMVNVMGNGIFPVLLMTGVLNTGTLYSKIKMIKSSDKFLEMQRDSSNVLNMIEPLYMVK